MVLDWTKHPHRNCFILNKSILSREVEVDDYMAIGETHPTAAYEITFEMNGEEISLIVARHMRNMISVFNRNAGVSSYKNVRFLEQELFKHLDKTIIAICMRDNGIGPERTIPALAANTILLEGLVPYGWDYDELRHDHRHGELTNRNLGKVLNLSVNDEGYHYTNSLMPTNHGLPITMTFPTLGEFIYGLKKAMM